MQWITTTSLAAKLGLSDRTVRDWCMRSPDLAHKAGGIWQVNIRKLAEQRKIDLVELLLILQSPSTKLVKAVSLARASGLPRRTIAHWCKTRPHFAIRIGTLWYVDIGKLDVTESEIASKQRHPEQIDPNDQ